MLTFHTALVMMPNHFSVCEFVFVRIADSKNVACNSLATSANKYYYTKQFFLSFLLHVLACAYQTNVIYEWMDAQLRRVTRCSSQYKRVRKYRRAYEISQHIGVARCAWSR